MVFVFREEFLMVKPFSFFFLISLPSKKIGICLFSCSNLFLFFPPFQFRHALCRSPTLYGWMQSPPPVPPYLPIAVSPLFKPHLNFSMSSSLFLFLHNPIFIALRLRPITCIGSPKRPHHKEKGLPRSPSQKNRPWFFIFLSPNPFLGPCISRPWVLFLE